MMKLRYYLVILTCLTLLFLPMLACSQEPQAVEINFRFDENEEGWVGGFADLPLDFEQQGYDVNFAYAEIPVEGSESNGLFLTGNNHSDDLFMYITRQLSPDDGLKANARYNVILSFDMATEVPPGMMGIGGSPGESVYIKAGVVNQEPMSVEQSGSYVLNIDKGAQSQGGNDMIVIGDAAKGEGVGQDDFSFQYKKFNLDLDVTSSNDGRLWIIIGADSGFEGISNLYFDNIYISLKPIIPSDER